MFCPLPLGKGQDALYLTSLPCSYLCLVAMPQLVLAKDSEKFQHAIHPIPLLPSKRPDFLLVPQHESKVLTLIVRRNNFNIQKCCNVVRSSNSVIIISYSDIRPSAETYFRIRINNRHKRFQHHLSASIPINRHLIVLI